MHRLTRNILASLALLASTSVFAASESYGTLLAGTYQPSASFASLSVIGSGNVYSFTLTALDLNSLFSAGAFIGSIAVDTTPDLKLTGKNADVITLSDISGDATIKAKNGKGPEGDWDFQFDLGNSGANRLTDNESITWTATFSKPVEFADIGFALHVQGLSRLQGGSAWYVASAPVITAVPEPQTYAMLLSGLALLGFVARKRSV